VVFDTEVKEMDKTTPESEQRILFKKDLIAPTLLEMFGNP
jgi:hypothetical protein